MKLEKGKLLCEECRYHFLEGEMLEGVSPFEPVKVYGCPNCLSIDSCVGVCDEPGCKIESTCGTPTPDGYRRTCFDHMPQKEIKK